MKLDDEAFRQFLSEGVSSSEENGIDDRDLTDNEIDENIRLAYEIADTSDKDLFPEYIWTIMQHEEFGVEYIKKSLFMQSMDPEIRNMKKRYNDYYKWCAAMDIYEGQLEKLVDVYGSKKFVLNGVKDGLIPPVLPRKPILKSTKKNRRMLLLGIPGTKPVPPSVMEDEQSRQEIYDSYTPIPADLANNTDDDIFTIEYENLKGKQKKFIRSILDRRMMGLRKSGIYKRNGTLDNSFDAITAFMESKSFYKYDEKGDELDTRPIDDIFIQEEVESYYADVVWEDRYSANPITAMAGRVVRAEDADKLEVYTRLMEIGINPNLSKKDLKNSVFRMLKRELGSSMAGPLTKKERKRLKKEQRKARKAERKQQRHTFETDEFMSDMLRHPETLIRDEDGNISTIRNNLSHLFDSDV